MEIQLVNERGEEIPFQKGMGLYRLHSEPELVRVSNTPDRENETVYFGRGGGRDNKLPFKGDLFEAARLLAAFLGCGITIDKGISPSVGKGYRFV